MDDSVDPDHVPERQTGVGCYARLTLPDGQQLDVPVIRRERAQGGTWWYTLALDLPARVDTPTGSHVEPYTVEVAGRYPDEVQPIPGEDYSVLDPPRPQGPADVAILVQHQWRPGAEEPLLHRTDCWVGHGTKTTAGLQEAARLLAGRAVACDVCRPEQIIRQR